MKAIRRRLLLSAGAIMIVLATTLLVGWWQVDGPSPPQAKPASSGLPRSITTMDFNLTDHTGRRVGPKDWIGQPTLVFFGFTYCPDVCPKTLADISGWLDALGEEAERLNVAFITVDPERDTVEAVSGYVSNFHRKMTGYTGTPGEIAKAAADFRAFYKKVPLQGGDYTMSHTASVFLFRADGSFIATIDYHEPPEIAVSKIKRALL